MEPYDEFLEKLDLIKTRNDLLVLKSNYLGSDGVVTKLMQTLRNQSVEDRKINGPKYNKLKDEILSAIEKRLVEIEIKEAEASLKPIDITLIDSIRTNYLRGGLHPITIIKREIEDLFLSMGFEVLDGPHIETEFFNFDALNIPQSHPARDMQDTFWLNCEKEKYLLRTHTSSVQVRGMLERTPPFKFIVPGAVFRCERTDASHNASFYQVEGMFVDTKVTVSNLIYFMKTILKHIFKRDVEIRLRPGFFPFVEPGFELDIRCHICGGSGCSVCKHKGWVELLPCGMIHPKVLEHGKINPSKYSGFAFGLGFDRLVMMRYGINDIRLLLSGDLRFNEQFA